VKHRTFAVSVLLIVAGVLLQLAISL